MSKRRRTPVDVEASILTKSARRCCLCFALNSDFSQKKGQIAHLDKNPGNSEESNLAYLCFDHHTAFDASNSQDKNYTAKEIELAQKRLYERVASRNGRLSIDLKFRSDGFTVSYEPKQVSPAQLKAVVAAMSDYYEKLGGGGFVLDEDGTGKDDTDA